MAPQRSEFVLVGRVVKPHGLRGEVLLRSESENPDRFAPGVSLMMGKDADSARPVVIESSRNFKGALLVRFEGIGSMEQAEPLRELLLFVDSSELDELDDEDAFWEHQVVGLEVFDTAGAPLGTVREVFLRPAQDLWSIETPSGEVLFPAAKELVVSVDLEAGRAVVDPPAGLFES
ncbi:MAG TPA: ribosome maturation factor RimM [Actinomycetota bacterium]|nr:ribosome maturation factor RimM [Actinomycetota bacterium]